MATDIEVGVGGRKGRNRNFMITFYPSIAAFLRVCVALIRSRGFKVDFLIH
jgi:hypothetical protein